VIGAHEDTIASGGPEGRAPGADDDASGLACLFEIFRVLISGGFRPKRSIHFIAFAAEEGGLLGSKDIAKEYKKNQLSVVGMLQMEMSGYRGRDKITILRDTSNEMANYLGVLAEEYLPNVGHEKGLCGYGCSDHFAFSSMGFSSVAVAESGPRGPQLNPNIHTAGDTFDKLDMEFLSNFVKLGLAFAIEFSAQ
jgi:leucyl aminopeptidase